MADRERIYAIRPDEGYFYAGVTDTGEQVLMGLHCPNLLAFRFDGDGNSTDPAASCHRNREGVRMAKKTDGAAEVLAKIAAMPEPFRAIAERLHALILRAAPSLKPKVWFGMPGYATNGPVLCFFRVDAQFVTFGLTEKANHRREEGATHQLMASAWFFTDLDEPTEERLVAIVRAAVNVGGG